MRLSGHEFLRSAVWLRVVVVFLWLMVGGMGRGWCGVPYWFWRL